MANFQQALADFCQEVGLDAAELGSGDEVQFRMGDESLLGVVQSEDDVLVLWSQPLRYDMERTLLEQMRAAASIRSARHPLQVGLRATPAGHWLVLGTRLPQDAVTARAIRDCYDFLRQWHQSAVALA